MIRLAKYFGPVCRPCKPTSPVQHGRSSLFDSPTGVCLPLSDQFYHSFFLGGGTIINRMAYGHESRCSANTAAAPSSPSRSSPLTMQIASRLHRTCKLAAGSGETPRICAAGAVPLLGFCLASQEA